MSPSTGSTASSSLATTTTTIAPAATTTINANNNNNNNSIGMKCLAGGIGCGISGLVTNPMDVVKIKNQQFGGPHYGTFWGTARTLYQQQGIAKGFFKGATASVLREMTYSSLRMGLYEPIKDGLIQITNQQPSSPAIKWSSAFLSGAIGAAIFNPIDLVKVRFQSQLPGQPRPYRSISHALTEIYKHEGGVWKGWYNGVTPTVVRAAFLTCAQLGSYDVIKNNLLVDRLGMNHESTNTHFAAALLASVITTTAANPADVVKTRVMNDPSIVKGAGSNTKNKDLQHVLDIWKTSGGRGFLKGWTASYLRIGPHTIISFLLIERVRQLLGMTTY